jgi:glucose-6-phosphate dehydrogenase assembly protein OpcA
LAAVAQQIEARHALVIAAHCLAVDDAGPRAQAKQRLDDERKPFGQAVARTAVELHLVAILAGDEAEAVALDFMQPPSRRAG